MKNMLIGFSLIVMMLALSGCVTKAPYDYTALQASQPRSILVLPPLNNSIEVLAPYKFLSVISRPLAEKGYYVLPVAVVDRYFRENGLSQPTEIHAVPLDKLHKITGADAVLYVTIEDWGQKYQVIASNTTVSAKLNLIDAQTGTLLWDAEATATQSSDDGGAGLIGAIIGAIVTQVLASTTDNTPKVSRLAISGALNNGERRLLSGPYAETPGQ